MIYSKLLVEGYEDIVPVEILQQFYIAIVKWQSYLQY